MNIDFYVKKMMTDLSEAISNLVEATQFEGKDAAFHLKTATICINDAASTLSCFEEGDMKKKLCSLILNLSELTENQ